MIACILEMDKGHFLVWKKQSASNVKLYQSNAYRFDDLPGAVLIQCCTPLTVIGRDTTVAKKKHDIIRIASHIYIDVVQV
ncbi:jg24199 [Pararge aegeria aegeria]|uniref:Jg24199 protein n=1 Tax=Pararge aegeria aegeria TaxID=348720 RepID=A0A8S4R3X4_9NEOP|nr:jg24199 [Pararge aegeria aegeria]